MTLTAESVASHVQVVVRVRPLTPKEHLESPHACLSLLQPISSLNPECQGDSQPFTFDEDPLLARNESDIDFFHTDSQNHLHNTGCLKYKQVMLGKNHTYTFDTIYAPGAQQAHLFTQSVLPLLDRFMEGYHATVFAYGQVTF
jgi:Kinesin motor domain